MTYSTNAADFAVKIGNIRSTTGAMRDTVQDALVAATFMLLSDRNGGTSPLQQVLDAVGGAAHRQGISTWMETFAPVRFVNDKVLLHKDNWKKLDKETAVADFDAFMESIGANDAGNTWYQIAKEKNVTPSVYNAESRINSLIKSLNDHDCGGLATFIQAAVEKYNSATCLANAQDRAAELRDAEKVAA